MKRVDLGSRFVAAVALFALLGAWPSGTLAHEHGEAADPECRICAASGAEIAVAPDDARAPSPARDVGLPSNEVQLPVDSSDAAAGAPRAPPA